MNKPVNFKLAELLKAEGYVGPADSAYLRGELTKDGIHHPFFGEPKSDIVHAPTIGSLITWLWDEFNIWIIVGRSFNCFIIESIKQYDKEEDYNNSIDLEGLQMRDFTSFEEAYEVAITHYLTNKK